MDRHLAQDLDRWLTTDPRDQDQERYPYELATWEDDGGPPPLDYDEAVLLERAKVAAKSLFRGGVS